MADPQETPGRDPDNRVEYRDSRRAAYRILRAGEKHGLRRLLAFITVTLLAMWAWNTVTVDLPPDERAGLFLFLLAVGLWVTEAVPAFAVGLLILGYLVFVLGTPLLLGEARDVSAYLNTWSSPVIWLILGGFFMAEGLARTGLDRRLLTLAIAPAGTRPQRVLLAVMLTTAVGSRFISNTSTSALMLGAVLPLVRRLGDREPFGKALLLGIPMAASLGGMGTIIGSAPNAIAAGVAAELGQEIDFLQWMLFGVPVGLGLVFAGWRLLLWRFPPGVLTVDVALHEEDGPDLPERRERWIVAGLSLATVALWITEPLHGIHVAVISLIPIVGLTMSQVLGAQQVRGLPWDTLMLISGGLALGAAVVDTGLAQRMAGGLEVFTAFGVPVLTFAALALLTVVLSNFMSNTATVSLVLPVAVALAPGRELEMCLVLGMAASCALMLPVSTPPNAVVYSTGLLRLGDLRPGGLAMGLLGPAAVIVWVFFMGWMLGL
ncbi:MAG: DASS family sodium-coupled anion symporter [Gammaproteobacteria bacterium]